ncbi:hypothetical protein [Pseudonocardia sp. TRM90224]|uniref:hypothetical protein n=1 Tax=Pseudonocardia sp. TRM90224 TaxID=2812678 RepID=UPI001E603D63|nr:hypothetical protein [Pseudonocardia sp. TRM90224]
MTTSYKVTARRWGSYWELDIEGVGVTQARTLSRAERMVRDYLELDGHSDAATAAIIVTHLLDGKPGQ